MGSGLIDLPTTGRVGLPTRYVPVGEKFTRYGVDLTCVLRPKDLAIADACRGCWFSKRRRIDGRMVNCNDIQCSRWDRMDEKNVWYIEEKDD